MQARRRQLLALIGAAAGTALFAYAVRRAGAADIVDGIRRVGWGLVFILAIGGVRFLLRAECWRLCMPDVPGRPDHFRQGYGGPPKPAAKAEGRPLRLMQAFNAFVAGDALGNVTPLGLLASEPAKVFLTRHHLATRESVQSLAVEALVYSASVVVMVAVGIAVLMATIALPPIWEWAGAGALVALAAGALVMLRLLRGTWDEERGQRPAWRERLAGLRVAVLGFSAEYRGRLWRVLALDLGFHALAVIEIYVTLQWLIGGTGVTLAQAIVFEALNRVVTVAFKFVPFRIGVDEAFAGALAPMLAIDPAAGVTLAVIRKIRNLFWSGVGLVIVAVHPARAESRNGPAGPQNRTRPTDPAQEGRETGRRENASAHRP
jgi:hypothetical protein